MTAPDWEEPDEGPHTSWERDEGSSWWDEAQPYTAADAYASGGDRAGWMQRGDGVYRARLTGGSTGDKLPRFGQRGGQFCKWYTWRQLAINEGWSREFHRKYPHRSSVDVPALEGLRMDVARLRSLDGDGGGASSSSSRWRGGGWGGANDWSQGWGSARSSWQ